MVGIMVTSSNRTYANMLHPPGLLLPVFLSPRKACADSCLCRRPSNTHRQIWLSLLEESLLPSPGAWCAQDFVCVLQESLVGMGFYFNMTATFSYGLVFFPLPLNVRYLFLVGSNILLLMTVQKLVAILMSLQEKSVHT